MCGLAGFANADLPTDAAQALLKRLTSLLARTGQWWHQTHP